MGYADRKTIVVKINKETGGVHSETFGYVGATCIEDLDKLMADLVMLTEENHKPERWQTELVNRTDAEVKREI